MTAVWVTQRGTWALVALFLACTSCGEDAADRTVQGQAPAGEVALWRLGEDQRLGPSSTSFTALVTRLECSNGVTGKVLPPELSFTADEIVVTFSVATNHEGAANCQGNDEVPWVVELGEPLGTRRLVDGQCVPGASANNTSFCSPDSTRYTPN